MTEPLQVLLVEDSESDADLIIRHLVKAAYEVEFERVETAEQMKSALQKKGWDIVISDYNMPMFDALAALSFVQEAGRDIPFIVVSGTIGEETAVGLMKAGAHDYLMKDKLTRLVPVVKRELAEARVRREHINSQKALFESEIRYRMLFDQSPYGVLILDPETSLPIDFNTVAYKQLGYTRDEFARLTIADYEVLKHEDRKNNNSLEPKDGEWDEYETRHRTKSGEIRNVYVTVRNIMLDGRMVLHCVHNDITDRKRIETSFYESEQRFQTLTELLPVGVYLADENGKCMYANKKLLEMAGMTMKQAQGDGWNSAVHPEDRDSVLSSWEKMVSSHGKWGLEYRFQTPQGKITWVHGLARELTDDQGSRIGYIGANIDITERKAAEKALKESEEKFRKIFENSGVGISLLDLNGQFTSSNPAITKILGYTPEEYTQLNISNISHPDDKVKDEFLYNELIDGKRSSFSIEKRNRHKDGHFVWGQLTNSIVRDANEKPLFSIGMFEDISDRKAMEEGLRESKEHYQSLFQNMMNGFAFCQMLYENDNPIDFIYHEVNEAFPKLTGLKDVTGKRVSEVIPGIRASDPGLFEIYSRVALSGNPEWFEVYVESLKDWYSISVYSPKKEFFVAVFDVITERKRAEESLRKTTEEIKEAYDATLQGWADALEMRERETAGHSKRTVRLTIALARLAGISEEEIIHIERGALLHDIGKMGIPDSILLKPGPLTDDEWVVMRQHPMYAYRLLSHIPYLRPALDIPYFHHEHWDGNGYPQGLSGKDIPLSARIFAVIDVWDALSSDRPYRPAWTRSSIKNYIETRSGKQFDPAIVKLFFNFMEKQPKI